MLKNRRIALESPYSIYERAKLTDMNFNNFTVDGVEHPLSFGLFEDEWEYENNEEAELTWMRQPHYYMGFYPILTVQDLQ